MMVGKNFDAIRGKIFFFFFLVQKYFYLKKKKSFSCIVKNVCNFFPWTVVCLRLQTQNEEKSFTSSAWPTFQKLCAETHSYGKGLIVMSQRAPTCLLKPLPGGRQQVSKGLKFRKMKTCLKMTQHFFLWLPLLICVARKKPSQINFVL